MKALSNAFSEGLRLSFAGALCVAVDMELPVSFDARQKLEIGGVFFAAAKQQIRY